MPEPKQVMFYQTATRETLQPGNFAARELDHLQDYVKAENQKDYLKVAFRGQN